MQKTVFFKLLSAFLCVVLVAATALFATGCTDDKNTDSSSVSSASSVTSDTSTADDSEMPDTETSPSSDGKTHLGTGEKQFDFEVKNSDGSTNLFVINTDKSTVGEALIELELISGDEGPYGLYVKTVNGVTLDYDTDGKYWAFYINGEYGTTGVDTTEIVSGTTYSFVAE